MMTNKATEDKTSDAVSGQNEPVVIGKANGIVTYDVCVTCPHCKNTLYLNQYPYNEEAGRFSSAEAEDKLREAIFGVLGKPAQREEVNIPYNCCRCKLNFIVGRLYL